MTDAVIRAVNKARGAGQQDMAASIAFFSFFSIFPLGLAVISIGSLAFDSAEVQSELAEILGDALPLAAGFVRDTVEAVFRYRGTASVGSVIALLWSGRKVFGAVSRGVNEELELERPHPGFLSPLRQFVLAVGVPLLLLLLLGVSTLVDLIPQFLPDGAGARVISPLAGQAASLIVVLVALTILYRVVPYHPPTWSALLPAAVLAGVLFQVCRTVFVIYFGRMADLEAVYGSLTSVILVLIWLYVSGRVLLLGADMIWALSQPTRATVPAGASSGPGS
jgi:membrane protein